uniref:Uncharacterized protein n=1 Tax=Anopheles coluzzii TaxID=1518534 RepID=A0A8W7Q3G7_ANOCL
MKLRVAITFGLISAILVNYVQSAIPVQPTTTTTTTTTAKSVLATTSAVPSLRVFGKPSSSSEGSFYPLTLFEWQKI